MTAVPGTLYRVVNYPEVRVLRYDYDPDLEHMPLVFKSRPRAEAIRRRILKKLLAEGKVDSHGRRLECFPENDAAANTAASRASTLGGTKERSDTDARLEDATGPHERSSSAK